MVCELQVPIVTAGTAAFVAIDDLEQIPMQAGLIGTEPLNSRPTGWCRLQACRQALLLKIGICSTLAILVSGSPHRARNIFLPVPLPRCQCLSLKFEPSASRAKLASLACRSARGKPGASGGVAPLVREPSDPQWPQVVCVSRSFSP